MDWVKLAIPLIAVAVWILANLARVPRDQPRVPPRRPQLPGGEPPPEIPRQPVTDVDQFLAEVNRRRRQTAERSRPAPEQPPPAPPPARRRISPTDVPPESRTPSALLPKDVPIPVRPVAQPAPPEPRSRLRPADSAQGTIPEVVRVAHSKRLVDNTEFPGLAPDAPQPTLAPTAAPGTAQVVAKTPITEAAAQVMDMLRDPQSVRVAFLLREILDTPLCRRPRHRLGRPA